MFYILKFRAVSLAATFLIVVMSQLPSALQAKEPHHINISPEGIAVKGYDLVSYFGSSGPAEGNRKFEYTYDGATYLFASAQNRDLFEKTPKKYLPAYGGFCSYGVVLGKKYDISPDAWRIVDGTLFFELNKGTRMIWDQNREKFIEIGKRNWPSIKHIPANDL